MKILISGAAGQLGKCLQDRLRISSHVVTALDSKSLDICSSSKTLSECKKFNPDIVVNAAAYTAVDKAEEELDRAFAVNELGPENLAIACDELNIPLIHISTDYVFNGRKKTPYLPEDNVDPTCVYGRSKLAGEKAISRTLERYIILRTAWVFSEYGNNFVKTMLRLADSRNELSVVDDQLGCPTYAGDIATAIINICEEIEKGNKNWGVYHCCGDKSITWHKFACEIFEYAFAKNYINNPMVVDAITTDKYPTAAKRPAYSILNCTSLFADWHVSPFNLRNSLNSVIDKVND